MPDIRINQLPLATGGTAPTGTDFIAIDGTSTRKAPLSSLADVIRPMASQAEAEAGINSTKGMSPLTTKQSIASEVGVTLATSAQGDLADSALQPGDARVPSLVANTFIVDNAAATLRENKTFPQVRDILGSPHSIVEFAALDGVTNNDSAFATAKTTLPGQMIDLRGGTAVLSTLPYSSSGDANTPTYYNGKIKVSGVDYPMHGVGSLISAQSDTQYQQTAHRVFILGGERVRVRSDGNSPSGAIASSRVDINGNRNVSIANVAGELPGQFDALSAANRYTEVGGQRSLLGASLLTRIWGVNGITDYTGRYGLPATGGPFDPAYKNAAAIPGGDDDQFYVGGVAVAGVDFVGGSTNFAASSRGEYSGGDTSFAVSNAMRVFGSKTTVLSSQGGATGRSVGGNGCASISVQYPQIGSTSTYSALLACSTASSGTSLSLRPVCN